MIWCRLGLHAASRRVYKRDMIGFELVRRRRCACKRYDWVEHNGAIVARYDKRGGVLMEFCLRSCSCRGKIPAWACPEVPGCDKCSRMFAYEVDGASVVGHAVAHHSVSETSGLVLVHLHPGESVHGAVRREVPDEERPRWMN